jgi:hypothetical protein
MTDTPHKPLWPKIVATVVLLPVLYVASFGPACWSVSRARFGVGMVDFIYQPMLRVTWQRGRFRRALQWYVTVGAADDTTVVYGPDSGRYRLYLP